jgi:ABC-type Fe3+ transport system permease subunit
VLKAFAECAVLGIAAAVVALTVTKSSLFAPIRDRLEGRRFLGKLSSCPYCFSHWAALGFVLAARPDILPGRHPAFQVVVGSLVVVAFAMPTALAVFLSYKRVGRSDPPVEDAAGESRLARLKAMKEDLMRKSAEGRG